MEQIRDLLQRLRTWFFALDMGTRVSFLAGVFGLTALCYGLWLWATQPQWVVLSSNYSMEEMSSVSRWLTDHGYENETRNGNQSLMVHSNEIDRIRLDLASEGLPGGSIWEGASLPEYEADPVDPWMSIRLNQALLQRRLEHLITKMRSVSSAQVNLALPEPTRFARGNQEVSAAVFLVESREGVLGPSVGVAIQNLVSQSVPRLSPESVSVFTQSGRAIAQARSEEAIASNDLRDARRGLESESAADVMALLEPVYGSDNVQVVVSHTVNTTPMEREVVTYTNPQIVSETRESTLSNETGAEGGIAGAAVNVEGNPDQAAGGANSETERRQLQRVVNRETQVTYDPPGTRVLATTVSVLINQTEGVDAEGNAVLRPTADELEAWRAPIAAAIGLANPATELSLAAQPFTPAVRPVPAEPSIMAGFEWGSTLRILLAALATAAAFLLVFLPITRRIQSLPLPGAPGELEAGVLGDDPTVNPALRELLRQIANGERQPSREAISYIVRNDPERSSSTLRSWLRESSEEEATANVEPAA